MGSDFLTEMGLRIKYKRTEAGLSQQELADKCGFQTRSAISMVESGKRDITRDKIILIAQALGVSPAYLMGWENKLNSIEKIEAENYAKRLVKLPADKREIIYKLIEQMEG